MAKAKQQDMMLSFGNSAKQDIDVAALTDQITRAVTATLTAEFEGKLQIAMAQANTVKETRRERLVLTGSQQYTVEADSDGLSFSKKEEMILLVGKNGQLSTGTRSARTVGKGSAHFKAGYSSEAVMPTSGLGSTRGVIVEGDGDDEKTFSLRAVSRMNRQGVNVFSDGALGIGTMEKFDNSTLNVYHRQQGNGVQIAVPSKDFVDSAIRVDVNSATSKNWNVLRATADSTDGNYQTDIAKINGQGDILIAGSLFTNNGGYAEMFEWADGNHRGESRYGFTVTVDAAGKLRIADEGDSVLGVVVPGAAFIGNSQWGFWKDKFQKDEYGIAKKTEYDIVEWLDTETTKLHSYYKQSLPAEFSLPENAVEIQTDEFGNALNMPLVSPEFDSEQEYVGRPDRNEWAIVCVLGTVPVYKGQTVAKSWIKLNELSDEIELMLIK